MKIESWFHRGRDDELIALLEPLVAPMRTLVCVALVSEALAWQRISLEDLLSLGARGCKGETAPFIVRSRLSTSRHPELIRVWLQLPSGSRSQFLVTLMHASYRRLRAERS